ncbi:N-terminal fungal transcription regulatory domain-containing protein [Calycina marina]|uniref:N-terminal fungal transcription regulatory domain-containing protein n=1 Tax=Calycina marina TaxID=1763456 RepID=A0A9P7YZ16_9HELO|nr:N-terminal fungal transcription regulatory domain-containing protein [Calycina marina]
MSSSLSTPPLEENTKSHQNRKPIKKSNSPSRTSKRASNGHQHGAVVADGRHKRVWKACERCRMKKTKCDGESPCKRCKYDGLVCTAGRRKKTEFKQLPRGYAEVLENTQYALIATVHKLYSMVRNNESWELGEPEINCKGQPVIHDIALKLGCTRVSSDLPQSFPEGSEDYAELQVQMQVAHPEMGLEDTKMGSSSHSSPSRARTERASSSESDHCNNSLCHDDPTWPKQQQAAKKTPPSPIQTSLQGRPRDIVPINSAPRSLSARNSCDISSSMPSPLYTDFPSDSQTVSNDSPFTPWSANSESFGQSNTNLSTHYVEQPQQYQNFSNTSMMTTPLSLSDGLYKDMGMVKSMQFADSLNLADGTIRPNMLDRSTGTGFDIMDSIMYNDDYQIAKA